MSSYGHQRCQHTRKRKWNFAGSRIFLGWPIPWQQEQNQQLGGAMCASGAIGSYWIRDYSHLCKLIRKDRSSLGHNGGCPRTGWSYSHPWENGPFNDAQPTSSRFCFSRRDGCGNFGKGLCTHTAGLYDKHSHRRQPWTVISNTLSKLHPRSSTQTNRVYVTKVWLFRCCSQTSIQTRSLQISSMTWFRSPKADECEM